MVVKASELCLKVTNIHRCLPTKLAPHEYPIYRQLFSAIASFIKPVYQSTSTVIHFTFILINQLMNEEQQQISAIIQQQILVFLLLFFKALSLQHQQVAATLQVITRNQLFNHNFNYFCLCIGCLLCFKFLVDIQSKFLNCSNQ